MRVRHGALRPTEEAVEHAGRLVEARRHPYEAILAQQVPHRTTQMRRACVARARGININISRKTDTKVDAHARLQAGARARREVGGGRWWDVRETKGDERPGGERVDSG